MKALLNFLVFSLLVPSALFANDIKWKQLADNPDYLHRAIKQVTDVIIHDVYSPPVASRTYAYITIAGYETARYNNPDYVSLAGQLKGLTPFDAPDPQKQYSYSLAAVNAILLTGKTMVISEDMIEDFRVKILQEFMATGMPQEVFNNSIAFGKNMADHILTWAAQDNYKKTRSLPKYTVTDDNESWKPTPPAYMKAVEPYWNKIRTFAVDSAGQFKPLPATIFSTDKSSAFYKEALEVQNTVLNLTAEQTAIANFWDCNPFKMNINGHVMYATKKISPGGHWINITRLACRQTHADIVRSAEAYACLSVVLADAFISCWDEKYRSRVIRPETYINTYISQDWTPLLQTPPFPEYTSGHSVVSAASAVVLTRLFGEKFVYTDSTEVEFDIPVRHFNSFSQAAAEAAISRLYGGIHYMPAIKNGMLEGEAIGKFISAKLKTRKDSKASKKHS
ncbi:MAG: vanadium-dependent haloperoxidase [Chitinophagaceae bacterium]